MRQFERVGLTMKKSAKARILEEVSQFFQESTVHGLSYLGNRSSHYIIKTFWVRRKHNHKKLLFIIPSKLGNFGREQNVLWSLLFVVEK